MREAINSIFYYKELLIAYIFTLLAVILTAASYGLFPIHIDTATGFMKTFLIIGVFFIPFIITTIISSEMRSIGKLTDYMQGWADLSTFWICLVCLTQTIFSKSPNFFTWLG